MGKIKVRNQKDRKLKKLKKAVDKIQLALQNTLDETDSNEQSSESSVTSETEEEIEVSKQLFEVDALLGENPDEVTEEKEYIHDEITARWKKFVKSGVEKTKFNELIEKYKPGPNCQFLAAPKIIQRSSD